jgi:hypothetical protein
MDKNQGYAILKAVMLENGRGFALGEHPTAPSRYVTWACYDDKDGLRQYEWGHYGNDRTAMEQDFTDRVQDYQRIYNVGIRQTEAPGLYKYYSTQRPVDIGTFPKPPYNSRMKFSITISASRWKMARSWLGVILPIPAP